MWRLEYSESNIAKCKRKVIEEQESGAVEFLNGNLQELRNKHPKPYDKIYDKIVTPNQSSTIEWTEVIANLLSVRINADNLIYYLLSIIADWTRRH